MNLSIIHGLAIILILLSGIYFFITIIKIKCYYNIKTTCKKYQEVFSVDVQSRRLVRDKCCPRLQRYETCEYFFMDKTALSADRLELSPPFPLGVLKRSSDSRNRFIRFRDNKMDFVFFLYGPYGEEGELRVNTFFQGGIMMAKEKYAIKPCDHNAGVYVLRKYNQNFINRPWR